MTDWPWAEDPLAPALFEMPRPAWMLRRCPVCGCSLRLNYSHTYVVQRQGWVKIGATSMPRRRINELARPAWIIHILSPDEMDWLEPLVTLRIIEGNEEHELHERFAECHVIGEWFMPNDDMKEWLSR